MKLINRSETERELPLYLQVREAILREISDEHRIGDKISTEQEFVNKFGVHRGTVRKAITVLADDGIIERIPGKGTFLARSPDEKSDQATCVWNIALCLPTKTGDLMFNPFYSQLIEAVIATHEVSTNITIHRLDEKNSTITRILERVADNGTNGVIIVGGISDKVIERFKASLIPIVLGDIAISDGSVDAVVTNNMDASFQALEYLIGLGHKQIATIAGPADDKNCSLRLKGYRMALAANHIDENDELIVHANRLNRRAGFAAMESLLKSGREFSAVVAANDALAFGAIVAIRLHGLSIPDDISIVGFDDIAGAEHTIPPLTTIRVDKHQMGLLVVERMISRLTRYYLPPQEIQLTSKLVIRKSCKAPKNKRS